jgi:hypothetical protein
MRKFVALSSLVCVFLSGLIAVFVVNDSAHALPLDPNLHGLIIASDTTGRPVPDQVAFNGMTRAYGLAMAPIELSPANTIGVNAVETELSFNFNSLGTDTASWVSAINQTSPATQLNTTRFSIRKGLPYSFELQGQMGYLLNSELWTVGAGAKWALNEAVRSFPIDFSVNAYANRVVGSTQMDLSMVSYGATLGTQFGVLGMVNIAPFVAWRPVMIFAGSNTLDSTPGTFGSSDMSTMDGGAQAATDTFAFARTTETVQRASGGLRFLFGVLRMSSEFMWTPHQTSFNVSLGLQL